jgi:hypothetical protein
MIIKEEDKGNVFIKNIYDNNFNIKRASRILLKNKEYNNKDIIQSYIITAAKYDFSVYEKRILYRVIDCFQYLLEGKKLDSEFSITRDLYGDVDIVLPLSSVLVDKDEHHSRVKKALISLLDKKIIVENNAKEWEAFSFVERPKIKERGIIRFRLHPIVYEALLDFSKGYRKYELETAMTFRSVYSMRFYELLSGQTTSLSYSIDDLKSMFKLENKYKNIKLFVFYVVEPAKRELDLKAPFSFSYQLEYERNRNNHKCGRKKIIGITFTPVYNLKNRDKILARKDEYRKFNLAEVLIRDEISLFISFGFTEIELKTKYYNLFQDINLARKQGKILLNSYIFDYAKKAKNPKHYIIKVLREEVKKWGKNVIKNKLSHMSFFEQKNSDLYKKDKASVYSFLKNHLGLFGNELEIGVDHVMEKGGGEYFNKIISYSNGDSEKIKKHIYNVIEFKKIQISKLHDKSETKLNLCLNKQKIKKNELNNIINTSESNIVFNQDSIHVSENILKVDNQIDINMCLDSKIGIIDKKLKKDWINITVKNLSFKEKIIYIMKFKSKSYLKKKAEDLKLSIYI